MTDYPATLPCPTVADYKGTVDFGFNSVTFNRGNTRRRRMVSAWMEKYDVTVVLTTKQLWDFQSWANMFGYDWHFMPLVSHYSGFAKSQGAIAHRSRFISDINISAMNADTFRVRVSVEIDPLTRPLGIVVRTGNWIIAGTSPAPSTPDWIIARTPANPSPDVIEAGTPDTPAA